MPVGHQLVGYSRVTDRLVETHEVAVGVAFDLARILAKVPSTDPDCEGCYPLDDASAMAVALQIGAKIDTYAHEYFLEGYVA